MAVLLVLVAVAVAVLPAVEVAVAVNVIVPSFSELTSMPLIDQVPAEPTVAVTAAVVVVPSVATSEIVAPAVPVPLAVTAVLFDAVMGFVTDVMATDGATVFLVEVSVLVAELLDESVAVAV